MKFLKSYKAIALTIGNVVILIIVLNLSLYLLSRIWPKLLAGPDEKPYIVKVQSYGSLRYGFDLLRKAYPGYPDGKIAILLVESANVELICDKDVGFREKPFEGYFFHISKAGFRNVADQSPWPPDKQAFNIFVFGGSTTLGFGAEDSSTIPSYLQQHLRTVMDRACVYNFGHSAHFSLQERWEFERLLKDDYRPDVAIFIDGLNDFSIWHGEPHKAPCQPSPDSIVNLFTFQPDCWQWPLQRAAYHFAGKEVKQRDWGQPLKNPPVNASLINKIIQRWLQNKKAVESLASKYGLKTIFVIQPLPYYAYDRAFDPFLSKSDSSILHEHGYAELEKKYIQDAGRTWSKNVLNLARLGEPHKELLYVDAVHYNASFAREIAGRIAEAIQK